MKRIGHFLSIQYDRLEKKEIEEKIGCLFVGTLIIFWLTYTMVCMQIDNAYNDYQMHATWVLQINRYNIFDYMLEYISYPLWHFTVITINKMLDFDITPSVAGATSFFNCIAFWGIVYGWDFLSNKQTVLKTKVFWAVCILLMGPLYAPSFNENYYMGQGTGNVWHNPTHIAVKGFAVLCFVWIVRLVNQEAEHRKWEYILLSGLLFMSALAKPSFLQAMIPGLGLYFIFELLRNIGGGNNKARIIHFCSIAATFIPSVFLLGVQFVLNFFTNTTIHNADGIGVGFGAVLSAWTDNLFISLLLVLAFPLFVLLIDAKNLLKDISVKLVISYGLCAWLEAALLYENGIRQYQGNWTWGWNLSLLIIWMLFVIKFLGILRDETVSSCKRMICLCLGVPILFFHVLFGIGYVARILVYHVP